LTARATAVQPPAAVAIAIPWLPKVVPQVAGGIEARQRTVWKGRRRSVGSSCAPIRISPLGWTKTTYPTPVPPVAQIRDHPAITIWPFGCSVMLLPTVGESTATPLLPKLVFRAPLVEYVTPDCLHFPPGRGEEFLPSLCNWIESAITKPELAKLQARMDANHSITAGGEQSYVRQCARPWTAPFPPDMRS
jgi:hypothetical protein